MHWIIWFIFQGTKSISKISSPNVCFPLEVGMSFLLPILDYRCMCSKLYRLASTSSIDTLRKFRIHLINVFRNARAQNARAAADFGPENVSGVFHEPTEHSNQRHYGKTHKGSQEEESPGCCSSCRRTSHRVSQEEESEQGMLELWAFI